MVWVLSTMLTLRADLNLFLKSLTHPDGTKVWATADLSTIPIGGYAIRGESLPWV